MFYALVLFSDKVRRRNGMRTEEVEEGTVGTFDTDRDILEFDEYLVDDTDGMGREWDMFDQGVGQTPPTRNPYLRKIRHQGGYELNKRKPPDGTGMAKGYRGTEIEMTKKTNKK